MRVDRICTRNIFRIPRSGTLEEAAVLMRRHHIGALVVTEDPPREAKGVGLVTDRDIVVQAIAKGYGVDELTAGDLMTPALGTVREDSDVHEALELMRAGGVRRLVVTDGGGEAIGMLSMEDVVDGIAADLASLAAVREAEVRREQDALEEAPAAEGEIAS